MVRGWLASESADFLVNKRSTTWRTLTQDQKDAKGDALITLIVENPTLVKRPVFESDKVIAVGFSPAKLLPVLKAGD
jgi:arsenate reductase